jgi:hypothetical protein
MRPARNYTRLGFYMNRKLPVCGDWRPSLCRDLNPCGIVPVNRYILRNVVDFAEMLSEGFAGRVPAGLGHTVWTLGGRSLEAIFLRW